MRLTENPPFAVSFIILLLAIFLLFAGCGANSGESLIDVPAPNPMVEKPGGVCDLIENWRLYEQKPVVFDASLVFFYDRPHLAAEDRCSSIHPVVFVDVTDEVVKEACKRTDVPESSSCSTVESEGVGSLTSVRPSSYVIDVSMNGYLRAWEESDPSVEQLSVGDKFLIFEVREIEAINKIKKITLD